MAICQACNGEMKTTRTCKGNIGAIISGVLYFPVPYEPLVLKNTDLRCHDCGIRPGGLHHQGCDMERCPKCEGQLINCDCEKEEGRE